jgi:hypothetical protein
MAYRVPEGHVLVWPEGKPTRRRSPDGLVIVACDQIVGRAWARIYPLAERELLQ